MTIREDEEQLLHVLHEIVAACSATRSMGLPEDFEPAADCTWTAPFTLAKGSGIESTGPKSGSVRHLPVSLPACGLALLRLNATIRRQRSKEDGLQDEPASKRAKGGPRSLSALKYGLLVRKHSGACAPPEDLLEALGPTVIRMLRPAVSNRDTTACSPGGNSSATTDAFCAGAVCGGAVCASSSLTAEGGSEGCGAGVHPPGLQDDDPVAGSLMGPAIGPGNSDASAGRFGAAPGASNAAADWTDTHKEPTAPCPDPSMLVERAEGAGEGGEGGDSPMAGDVLAVAALPARRTRKRAGGPCAASSWMGEAGKGGRPRVWQEFTERTAGGGAWWIYLPCAAYVYKSDTPNATSSPAQPAAPPAQRRVQSSHLEAGTAVAAAPAGPEHPHVLPCAAYKEIESQGAGVNRKSSTSSIGCGVSSCPVPPASWQPQAKGAGAVCTCSTASVRSGALVPGSVLPTPGSVLPSHQPPLLPDQFLRSTSGSAVPALAYGTTLAPARTYSTARDSVPGGCLVCNPLPSPPSSPRLWHGENDAPLAGMAALNQQPSPPSSPRLWHDGNGALCAVVSAPHQQVGSGWATNAESDQLEQLVTARWPGSRGTGMQAGIGMQSRNGVQAGTGGQAVSQAGAQGTQRTPHRWVGMPEPAAMDSAQVTPALALRLPSSPPSSPLLVPIWADSPGSLGMPTPGATMPDAGRLMDELMVELHGCHEVAYGSPPSRNPVLSTSPWDPATLHLPADSAILPGTGSWLNDNGMGRSVAPEPRLYPYQTQQTILPVASSVTAQPPAHGPQLSRPAAPTPAAWLPDVDSGQSTFEASHLRAAPARHAAPQQCKASECGRQSQPAVLAADQQPVPACAWPWPEQQDSEAICDRGIQQQPCIPAGCAAMPAAAQLQPMSPAQESGRPADAGKKSADAAQVLNRTAAAAAPAGVMPWGSPTNGSGCQRMAADATTHPVASQGAPTSSSTALLESLVQRLTLQPAPASVPDPASDPLWRDLLHPLYWDLLRGLVGVDTPQRSGADTLYDRCMELGLHPGGRRCFWHRYAVEPESKQQHGWTGRPPLVFVAWNWKNPEGSQWAPPGEPLCKARYAGHVSEVARAQQVHSLVEVAYRQGATREDVIAWVAAGRKALSHAVAARCVPVVEALLSHMEGLSTQDKIFAEPGGKWCVLHTACYKFKASRTCRETEEICARQQRILDMLLRFWLDDFVSCARQAGRPDPDQSALNDLTLLAPTLIREGVKVSRKGRQINAGLLVDAFRRLGVPVVVEEQSTCALESNACNGRQPAHDIAPTS